MYGLMLSIGVLFSRLILFKNRVLFVKIIYLLCFKLFDEYYNECIIFIDSILFLSGIDLLDGIFIFDVKLYILEYDIL